MDQPRIHPCDPDVPVPSDRRELDVRSRIDPDLGYRYAGILIHRVPVQQWGRLAGAHVRCMDRPIYAGICIAGNGYLRGRAGSILDDETRRYRHTGHVPEDPLRAEYPMRVHYRAGDLSAVPGIREPLYFLVTLSSLCQTDTDREPTGDICHPPGHEITAHQARVLRCVYGDCRADKHPGDFPEAKEKCARIAWGAAKRA